ncbi:MAG: aldo/keto reductase [Betaproteobacteria bacterium]|nr:MAG: aldo/keto reductase [Betaproteobacteria bacterium]
MPGSHPSSARYVTLTSGAKMPTLGMGTWRTGERQRDHVRDLAALQQGLDFGMTLIDTAEMYADGGAEKVIGEAIAGRRDDVFLVSKVYPHHASRRGVVAACERSLARLKTDRLDLYLLHWRGEIALSETVAGFEQLRTTGRIRHWGVSNFDRSDMEELLALPDGEHCAANQVLYHLDCRGIEWDLLPFCRRHGMVTMAYSPFDEGRLLRNRRLAALASRAGVTPAQVALAWLLAQPGVAVIPKATDPVHVHDNAHALDVDLSAELLAEVDRTFPPPSRATRLKMI